MKSILLLVLLLAAQNAVAEEAVVDPSQVKHKVDLSRFEPEPIRPMAEVQTQLEKVAAARTKADVLRQVATALEMEHAGKVQKRELIQQVLHYCAQNPEASRVLEVVRIGVIMDDLTDSDVIRAAGAQLQSDDPAYQEAAKKVLHAGDVFRPTYLGDSYIRKFHRIQSYLGNPPTVPPPDDPPAFLIRMMFHTDPSAALHSLRSIYLPSGEEAVIHWKDMILVDLAVQNYQLLEERGMYEENNADPAVTAGLQRLSISDHWWVRLYVAEIYRRHEGLRQEAVIERLSDDPNKLVRQCIQEIRSNDAAHRE